MPPDLPIVHYSCNLLLHARYCCNFIVRLLFFTRHPLLGRYIIIILLWSIHDHTHTLSPCNITLLLYDRELPCASRDGVAPDNFGCGAWTRCHRSPHSDAVHGRRKRQHRFHIAGSTFRRARAPHDTNNNNNNNNTTTQIIIIMIVSRDKSFVVIRVRPPSAVSVLRGSREFARAPSSSSSVLISFPSTVVVFNFDF